MANETGHECRDIAYNKALCKPPSTVMRLARLRLALHGEVLKNCRSSERDRDRMIPSVQHAHKGHRRPLPTKPYGTSFASNGIRMRLRYLARAPRGSLRCRHAQWAAEATGTGAREVSGSARPAWRTRSAIPQENTSCREEKGHDYSYSLQIERSGYLAFQLDVCHNQRGGQLVFIGPSRAFPDAQEAFS